MNQLQIYKYYQYHVWHFTFQILQDLKIKHLQQYLKKKKKRIDFDNSMVAYPQP